MAQEKEKKRKSGCLKIVVIGFGIFMILGFIGSMMSNKQWEKDRPEVLVSVKLAVESGDYNLALSLAEPHKSRQDAELNVLVSRANNLKREAEKKVREAKIAVLVDKIKSSSGEDRTRMLKDLISIDPHTKEFADEISSIRERAKKLKEEVDDFIVNGVGKKVPFEKWEIFGSPETLKGTTNKYWVAYLPEVNLSLQVEVRIKQPIF